MRWLWRISYYFIASFMLSVWSAYTKELSLCLSHPLTLSMLRLLLSKQHSCKVFWIPYKPCHASIHGKVLFEYSQMSTHMPGFQWFFSFCFFHHFVLFKLVTSSITVNLTLKYSLHFSSKNLHLILVFSCSLRELNSSACNHNHKLNACCYLWKSLT